MQKCYFCHKPGSDSSVDYCTATGRKTLPGLNDRNFDQRYGFPCHHKCLQAKLTRLAKRKAGA